jgi:hypothetical protein
MCNRYDGFNFPSEELLMLVDINLQLETTEVRNGLNMGVVGLVGHGLLSASISSALWTDRSYRKTWETRAVFEPPAL